MLNDGIERKKYKPWKIEEKKPSQLGLTRPLRHSRYEIEIKKNGLPKEGLDKKYRS